MGTPDSGTRAQWCSMHVCVSVQSVFAVSPSAVLWHAAVQGGGVCPLVRRDTGGILWCTLNGIFKSSGTVQSGCDSAYF